MEQYWHWLCSNLVGNPGLLNGLVRKFRTPEAVFSQKKKELLDSFPNCRVLLTRLWESKQSWDFEREAEKMKRKGISFLSCEHPDFPARLRNIPDRPGGIFRKGRLPVDECPSVAIVGARECSVYGRNLALWFSEELAANGVQIVSGMARGVDGYSHRGAFKRQGQTFAVLGGGVDVCYPEENRDIYEGLIKEGGILSESPPGIPPMRHLFPLRNRLISGLSDAVLIIEAKEKSGSLITADFALEQGRDVYAVPGRLGDTLSSGCNSLIRQGAGLALSPEKLLEELHVLPNINRRKEQKNKISLETSENLVYSCLSFQAKNLEEICCQTELPLVEVLHILTSLELRGYIKEVYKNYYTRA